MRVLSGIIDLIVLLLTKASRIEGSVNKINTSARINTLSGLLYVTRIFTGGMDDGFEATLNINDRDAGAFSMTIPCKTISQVQTVLSGNVAGCISKNRIYF
jgi:hypothetical protein